MRGTCPQASPDMPRMDLWDGRASHVIQMRQVVPRMRLPWGVAISPGLGGVGVGVGMGQ